MVFVFIDFFGEKCYKEMSIFYNIGILNLVFYIYIN